MNAQCSRLRRDLTDFVQGELRGDARRAVANHLAGCAACRREYEALKNVIDAARKLPRLQATAAFHRELMHRMQREQAVQSGRAAAARKRLGDLEDAPMSLPDRIRLNAGLVFFSLRHSVAARSLLAAAVILIAVLLAISILSRGRGEPSPLKILDNDTAGAEAPSEGRRAPSEERDIVVYLPEEPVEPWHGLGLERLEAPDEDLPAPSVSESLSDEAALAAMAVPAEDIRERTARENILELGRYRMFARFNPMCKRQVMEGRGGDAKTVYAVDRGLKWLRYNQEEDGSWDPVAFSRDPLHELGGDPRARVGLTALAVAAFLSDGHTETAGRYHDTVSSGLNYLLASRDGLGQFGKVADSDAISLFNHSVAMLVLAENFILSGGRHESELRLGAARLVSLVHRGPPPEGHGTFGETWTAMALRTYLITGLAGDEERLLAHEVESRVALLAQGEAAGAGSGMGNLPPLYSASIGAVGALFPAGGDTGALDDGRAAGDESVAGDESAAPFPDPRKPETLFALLDDPGLREPSFLFFVTTALCERPRSSWAEWNGRVKGLLLTAQDREGYWPAGGDWPWIDGGDVYTTALSILTLQVYYRFIKLEENCP